MCLDITGKNAAQCADVEVYPCVSGADNEQWNYINGQIITQLDQFCLTAAVA